MILNGAPRAGKSSIAGAIQETFDGTWMNLGVDVARAMTPPAAQPGIGLRPGEAAHPAAPLVPVLYAALYESIAAHARLGLNVVADVGLYDTRIAADAARRLAGLPVLFIGVRCPLETIAERRGLSPGAVPAPVRRWQREVHADWAYDLEVDTSVLSPAECAATIRQRLDTPPDPDAFTRLA